MDPTSSTNFAHLLNVTHVTVVQTKYEERRYVLRVVRGFINRTVCKCV